MRYDPMIVGEFLWSSDAAVGTRVSRKRRRQLEESESVRSIRQKVKKHVPGLPWRSVRKYIEANLPDALDVGAEEILGAAWAKVTELAKYLDEEKYPPEDTILVYLAEHTVTSTFHPSLKVLFYGESIGTIPFDVEVALELKGLKIKIKAGEILEAHTGDCRAKGSVAIAGHRIVEKKSEEIALPGMICFEKRRPIAAVPSPAS